MQCEVQPCVYSSSCVKTETSSASSSPRSCSMLWRFGWFSLDKSDYLGPINKTATAPNPSATPMRIVIVGPSNRVRGLFMPVTPTEGSQESPKIASQHDRPNLFELTELSVRCTYNPSPQSRIGNCIHAPFTVNARRERNHRGHYRDALLIRCSDRLATSR